MGRKKSGRKKTPIKQRLTIRQSRFAKAFMESRSLKEAAIAAGYSPKNASQSGNQALNDLNAKAPEIMASLGLTTEAVIKNHLVPLLAAKESKFAQKDGKFTDHVEVELPGIRLGATRTALELLNAFPPKDPMLAAQVGVNVVIIDVPRPDRSAIDVPHAHSKAPAPASGNGNKPDSRPKD
jgi:terminase small subunit-like protein